MNKISFKSNILNTQMIINCEKEYKKSLKTGNFNTTNKKIKQAIEELNNKYEIEEIITIINEEIKDEEIKYNLIINIVLSAFITILTSLVLKLEIWYAIDIGIIIITFIICKIVKEVLYFDNTNFLKYYKEQLLKYQQTKNIIDL